MPDAFGLDLAEPDDPVRIMKAEIAVAASKERRIDQQINGMGRSGSLYAFRYIDPVKSFRQRWIGYIQIAA